MKKSTHHFFNIGSSSILIILIILTLVIFATLSVVSANADSQLNKTLEKRTNNFYTASNQAELLLNKIDNQLAIIYNQTTSQDDYYNHVTIYLNKLSATENFTYSNNTINYKITVSKDESLSVSLLILYPNSPNNNFYSIQSWKLINTKKWEPDTSINVLKINHK